jgi:hypothetical protein
LRQALALLEEVIARDPNYGPALGLAAQCCHHLATGFTAPDRDTIRPKGIDFGRRAIKAAGTTLRAAARQRDRSVLAADHLALGERARAARPDPADGCYGRQQAAGYADQVLNNCMHAKGFTKEG